jgi:hypothetical protein
MAYYVFSLGLFRQKKLQLLHSEKPLICGKMNLIKHYIFSMDNMSKKKTRQMNVKKRGGKEGRSPQKYEGHSHIAPGDKKEWHSSFARNLGSGTRERRSKECRSSTHWT